MSPQAARRLLFLIVIVFAVGLAALVLVAPKDRSGRIIINSDAYLILSVGVATASYLAQRPAFRAWVSSHPAQRPGSVLEAIGLTVLYYFITAVIAAPLIFIAAQISGGTVGLAPQ
jgi:hypothetical protein